MIRSHRIFNPSTTCWTLVQGAAGGRQQDRDAFTDLYLPVIRAILEERWRRSPLRGEIDDAVQEVFLACFRDQGALEKVGPGGGHGGFRAYMNAVVRNIARRFETRWARKRKKDAGGATVLEKQEANEQHLSSAFDRAWMMAFLDQTMVLLKDRARDQGEDTLRRVELLRLRFNEDLPIRAIAQQWNRPADAIHYEYRKARKEFVTALRDVIAFHHPGDPLALEREIARFRDHINR